MENKIMEMDLLGQYYTSINNKQQTGVFALVVSLKNNVNPDILQKALNDLFRRLPFFNSQIIKGLFSYQLKQLDPLPKIKSAETTPMFSDYYNHGSNHLIEVVYGTKSIIVKATHSLCDGKGLAQFTIALLARYFELLGVSVNKKGMIDCHAKFQKEEAEDAVKHYLSSPPKRMDKKEKEAIPRTSYYINTANNASPSIISENFDATYIKTEAKKQNITISQYLLNCIFQVIKVRRDQEGKNNPINASLQIDCRSFFPSKTLRSFATAKKIIMPEIADQKQQTEELKKQFQMITKDYVHTTLYQQQKLLKKTRYIPRVIKDILMKKLAQMDVTDTTTGLSNLGFLPLPSEIEPYIDSFEFPIDVEKGVSHFFSCVTVGNTLTLTATFFEEGRNIVVETMKQLRKNEQEVKNK